MEMELLGQKVQVKTYLPYKEKIECAKELVSRAAVFDESGAAYWGYLKDAVCVLLYLKAYTNADVSAYESEDGLLALMDGDGLATLMDADALLGRDDVELRHFVWAAREDWGKVEDLADAMFGSAAKVHEKQCSLENKIKESFGFLFDGKDLTETLAQAKDVNEQMIDHLGRIAQMKRQAPVDMAKYAKKKK